MDIKEFENDLDALCEKHGIHKKKFNFEMPRMESNDIHVGTKSAMHPGGMRHKSIIKTECRETISIFVEFEAKEITLMDGKRFEEQ
jgi:hypothetical protein